MASELLALAAEMADGSLAASEPKRMPRLADHAVRTPANRERRQVYLPSALLGEPAWDMLLYLFAATSDGREVRTSALAAASGAPASTALRHIELLQGHGLVSRSPSTRDQRVTNVALTDAGIAAMAAYIARIASLSAAEQLRPPQKLSA